MVTRRAVLKGTAAASIGAIAAAHGAPAEAAVGYGSLEGSAVGGFYKFRDAFQVALKVHKFGADIFFKEEELGSIAIFFKFFWKDWTALESQLVSKDFISDFQKTELSFSKIDTRRAEFFLKDTNTGNEIKGTIEENVDGVFYKFDELAYNPDGGVIT